MNNCERKQTYIVCSRRYLPPAKKCIFLLLWYARTLFTGYTGGDEWLKRRLWWQRHQWAGRQTDIQASVQGQRGSTAGMLKWTEPGGDLWVGPRGLSMNGLVRERVAAIERTSGMCSKREAFSVGISVYFASFLTTPNRLPLQLQPSPPSWFYFHF